MKDCSNKCGTVNGEFRNGKHHLCDVIVVFRVILFTQKLNLVSSNK